MAAPNDAQRIRRAVYDANNNEIRSGLVPLSIPNNKAALLAYWQEQDAADAQAEAAAAEAEAAALAALEQQPANGEAMAIPALAAAIDQHATLIEALDQRTATIEAAQPDEILRLATQIQLGAGAAMALEAKALEVQAQIEATATGADQRLIELDQRMTESVAKVADLVTGGRQQLETTTATITADAKKQVAALVTSTVARVADMRGPKGTQGNPGASTVIGAGIPEGAAAMEPLIGRGAVVGDCFISGSDADRRAFRWDGERWEAGPAMATVQLRDVKVSALDAGQKVYPTVASSAPAGGGGGLMDPLIAGVVTKGASTPVADSSRWQSNPYWDSFTSGLLLLEIVPIAGAFGGKHHFMSVGFTLLAGAPTPFRFTEFSSLGPGFAGPVPAIDVSVDGALGAPTAPGSLGISIPPTAKPATRLFVTVQSSDPAATSFAVKGSVIWSQPPSTAAQSPGLPSPSQPAWLLV